MVEGTTNQAVCACTPLKGFNNDFLLLLLNAYKSVFTKQGAGGAQPNISREKIRNTPVPIVPTKEQNQIVLKVNSLLRLCDELEVEVQKSKHDAKLLMQVLTSEALKEMEVINADI